MGECAVDHGLVEHVERGVVSGASIAGGDADLVAGFLDRFDIEQVVVVVGVGARGPRLEPTGRDHVVEPRNLGGGQVAVVLGEQVAASGLDQTQAPLEHHVGGGGDLVAEWATGSDVLQAPAEAVLGGAGRERDSADAGVVRCDGAEVVGPVPDPARQLDRRRRTEVATRCGDGDSTGGERGQQHTVQPNRARIGSGETCQGAVGFGEQGIAGRSWREEALGRSEHDGDVDVEADGSGEGRRRDAMADTSLSGRCGVELGFQRRAEPVPGDRWADRVEVSEPVECTGERLVGPVLGLGEVLDRVAPEPLFELAVAPCSPLGPGARGARMSELVAQLADERSQRVGRLAPSAAGADGAESPVPVVVASHSGFSTDALPARRWQVLAVGIAQREVSQHVEQVAST